MLRSRRRCGCAGPRAKESLDLEVTPDRRLDPIVEEIRDLKAVWTALSGVRR
jgi:dynein heavy chain 1